MRFILLSISIIIFLISCKNNDKENKKQLFKIVKDTKTEIDTLNKLKNLKNRNGFRNIKLNSLYSSYNFGDDWEIQQPGSEIKIVRYIDSFKFSESEYPELSLYFFNDSLFCIDLDFNITFSKLEYLKSVYGNPTIDFSNCYYRGIDLGKTYSNNYFFDYYFYSNDNEITSASEKSYLSINKEFKKLNLEEVERLKKKNGGQLVARIIKSLIVNIIALHMLMKEKLFDFVIIDLKILFQI
jgi:hypothetical protein